MKRNVVRTLGIMMTAVMAFTVAGCGGAKSSSAKGKTYKVGIVNYMDHPSLNQIETSVKKELNAQGKKLGVTFDYKNYSFNGQGDGSTLNQIASQLVSKDVDVIIPIATPAAQVVQSATEDKNITMVYAAVSNPVTDGLADSMKKPGGNKTGTSDALNTNRILKLMQTQNKNLKKVGLLYSKGEASSKKPIQEAKDYLKKAGIDYVEKTGTNTDEIQSAADALVHSKVDAVFTPTDNTVQSAELSIYEKFVTAKIPHYAGADSFALNGAFVGYGVDYEELGKKTADMVADILVNGKKAGETAVGTFDNGKVVINKEVMEKLGLKEATLRKAFKAYSSKVETTSTAKEFKK